jgi:hypothetical protein
MISSRRTALHFGVSAVLWVGLSLSAFSQQSENEGTTKQWPADPENGVPLDGSGGAHLHRGTGDGPSDLPDHPRHGMRAWVTQGSDAKACKRFEQFQFSRTSVYVINASGTETDIDDEAGRFRNNNKYGPGTRLPNGLGIGRQMTIVESTRVMRKCPCLEKRISMASP